MIYAYILCNFQGTNQCVNTDNKIEEDNLLIQDSIKYQMIVNIFDFNALDLE